MRPFLILPLFLGLTACIMPDTSPRQNGKVVGQPAVPATKGPFRMSGCDQIIPLNAKSAAESTEKENEYIQAKYPGAKKLTQRLRDCGNRKVDVVTIEERNGTRREIFFDASSWFGLDLNDALDG